MNKSLSQAYYLKEFWTQSNNIEAEESKILQ